MNFKDLKSTDVAIISNFYKDPSWSGRRLEAQKILAQMYKVTPRTIRNWARELRLLEPEDSDCRVLIYDLETSRVLADIWGTGKQFVSHDSLHEQPRIITAAWKWLGEDKVYTESWEDIKAENTHDYDTGGWGDDKKLVERMVKVYNEADLVIGQNSDKFDNKILAHRSMVHGLEPLNRYIKSLDLYKSSRKFFRTPSYSMDYTCKVLKVTKKRSHEGISMWRNAQYHKDPEVRRKAVESMEKYNIGDILSTEAMYFRMLPYIDFKFHVGSFYGNEKWSCPNCGSRDIERLKYTTTPAGTVQHIVRCREDDTTYKISNSEWINFLKDGKKD